MSEQTTSNTGNPEDLTETTASSDIELHEDELNRVSGGAFEVKTEPFK